MQDSAQSIVKIVTKSLSCLIFSIAFPVAAAPISVCPSGCDHAEINDAVQAADPGDVITVEPGTYSMHVGFPTGFSGITIQSSQGRDVTTIDYGRMQSETGGSAVSMGCACGDCGMCPTVLDGFTITGGWSSSSAGGVQMTGGVLMNCKIIGNIGRFGGGIQVLGNEPSTISNTIIEGNQARAGGGVAINGTGPTVIENSQIIGNTANREGGGGVSTAPNSNFTTIRNTPIAGNTVNSSLTIGQGGGLFVRWAMLLDNSPVYGNMASGTSGGRGGGIYLSGFGMTLQNSSVTSNNTTGATSEGGGIYCAAPLEIVGSQVILNTPMDPQIFPQPATNCSVVAGMPTHTNKGKSLRGNDPVNTFTGELFDLPVTDLFLGGPMPLYLSRYYASGLKGNFIGHRLGNNWIHPFEMRMTNDGTIAAIPTAYGRLVEFQEAGGLWVQSSGTDVPYQLLEIGGEFVFLRSGSDQYHVFDPGGLLSRVEDGKGNIHTLNYGAGGELDSVSDGVGRTLSFTYDVDGLLETASDGTRTVSYGYTSGNLTSYTDALGNMTTYNYDLGHATPGQLTSTVQPETNTRWSQIYDAEARVIIQDDAFANSWSWAYDDITGITTVTNPLLDTQLHEHSGLGEAMSVTNETGDSRLIGYDVSGHLSNIVDEINDTTTLTAHADTGNADSITWPDGTGVSNVFSPRVNGGITFYDRTLTTFPDMTTHAFVYDALGNITQFTDRNGEQAIYTYDAMGQILTHTNPRGGVTTNTYNADGTRATVEDPAGHVTNYSYDGLLRISTVTRADTSTFIYTYDDANRLVSEQNENGEITNYSYDDNGNVLSFTDPLTKTSTFTYDAMDRVSMIQDPLGGMSIFAYDEIGRISSITDQNNNTKTIGYDAVGRPVTTQLPGGAVWTQGYNDNGTLSSITDPLLKTTSFIYNSMGRVTSMESPLLNSTTFSYDLMGRVSEIIDPAGRSTTFDYDNRSMLTQATLPGGIVGTYERGPMGLITRVTDPNSEEWLQGYSNLGQLISRTDPLGNIETYTYDNRNRADTLTLPGGMGSISFTYDGPGNQTREQYTDGTDLNLSYDAAGLIIGGDGLSLARDDNGYPIESNGLMMTRDPGGRIVEVEVSPGKSITYSYNSDDELTMVSDWAGGSATFSYDVAGRMTTVDRSNGVTTTYIYDDDDRLISISDAGGTVNTSINMTRDEIGRITVSSRDVPLSGSPSIRTTRALNDVDAANQIDRYSYDAMGHVTSDDSRTFDWSLASRLKSYTDAGVVTTYTYDVFGNLLSRTDGTTTREFTRNLAFELPCTMVVEDGVDDLRYYVCTPQGELLYSIEEGDSSRHFYHFDERGSTTFLTSDSGDITDAYAYDSLGHRIEHMGSFENPYTFLGRYGVMQEGNSGLFRTHRRLYDSVTGKFLSRDPLGDFSDPRLINLYQYAMGDPIQNVDYTGEDPEDSTRLNPAVSNTVAVAEKVTKYVDAVAGRVTANRAAELLDQADSIDSVNRLRNVWGDAPENVAKAKALRAAGEKFKRVADKFGAAAKTAKFVKLGLDAKEKGVQPVLEEGATTLAEKALGKTAGKVVKIGIIAHKTNEAVKQERRDMATNQDASVASHVKTLSQLEELYFGKPPRITYEQFYELYKKYKGTLDANLDGNTKSGNAGIIKEALEGLSSMLETFVGRD